MSPRLHFVVLWLLFGCINPLDSADKVHDLRLLAMRVEPPEQSVLAAKPVTASALIVDPGGGRRAVHCRWVTCAQLDGNTGRCLDDSPGFSVLSESDFLDAAEGGEPSMQFTPDPALLAQVQQLDTYRGLGGVRQVVQLELSAGVEAVVGIKRAVFLLPLGPPPTLNTNPVVGALEFNDAGWAPDASVSFIPEPPRPIGFRMMGGGGAVKNQLAVLEDKALKQDYQVNTFTGERRTLHETWRYNFFTTLGGFTPGTAGGADILGRDAGIETQWKRNAGEDGGVATIWVVVHDGRGGETWTRRQAIEP